MCGFTYFLSPKNAQNCCSSNETVNKKALARCTLTEWMTYFALCRFLTIFTEQIKHTTHAIPFPGVRYPLKPPQCSALMETSAAGAVIMGPTRLFWHMKFSGVHKMSTIKVSGSTHLSLGTATRRITKLGEPLCCVRPCVVVVMNKFFGTIWVIWYRSRKVSEQTACGFTFTRRKHVRFKTFKNRTKWKNKLILCFIIFNKFQYNYICFVAQCLEMHLHEISNTSTEIRVNTFECGRS